MSSLDLITHEVISGFLVSAADEMYVTLQKTAYSLNIKERTDCSTSVFDRHGQTIALSSPGPIHLGSMLALVAETLRRFPLETLKRGDMFLMNDPYSGGGSHLPDLTLLAPVFADGRVVAYVANIAHHSDIGGKGAGSVTGDASSIFQEGIRLPPMKIFDGGELRKDIVELVTLNSRVPHEREGDLRAQFASNLIGIRRLEELCARYGAATVIASMEALIEYGEKRIRQAIRAMPDGVYRHHDFMDDGRPSEPPVRIQVKLTIEGDGMSFDFEGTEPQIPRPKNMPLGALLAVVYTVIKQMIDPDLPTNAGYYRAIAVKAPEGSIVNCRAPAPVADRALTGNVVGDVIGGALSKAMPSRSVAASGPFHHCIVSGKSQGTDRVYVNFEAFAGGMGARADRDGLDAVRVWASGGANQSAEAMEAAYPIVVERYELAADTGGPGVFRGGMGCLRDLRVRTEALLSMTSGRQIVAAPGLENGLPGALGTFILNPRTDREKVLPPAFDDLALKAGTVVRLITPGGGGYGDPKRRDPMLVLADVVEERVSARAAREDYGVHVVGNEIDWEETHARRGQSGVDRILVPPAGRP